MAKPMICLNVMNTMWFDYRGTGQAEDRLTNPKWLDYFRKDWGLTHLPYPSAETIRELQSLRSLMRNILEKTTNNDLPTSEQISQLNEFMAKTNRAPSLKKESDYDYKLTMRPTTDNWETFISDVALSFSELFTKEQYKRLKFCKNTDCRWIFYDDTRNGRKHWCNSDKCGNLSRVRKHRENP